MKSLAPVLVVMLSVAGCAGVAPPSAPIPAAETPVPPAPAIPSAPADRRAAAPAALAVERQWLQSWFKGTPVLIEQRTDGAVNVDVPREFCFDAGRSTVQPALAAVLNKMAESLRRMPATRVSLLAAPEDAAGTASLAQERALQVQKHLLSRGVPAARLARPTVTAAAAVQLRMEAAAQP